MSITETFTLTTGTWMIEPMHSELGFTVRHLGLSRVRGRFNSFSATGTIRRSDFGIDFNAPLGMDGMLISDKVALELEIQLAPSG